MAINLRLLNTVCAKLFICLLTPISLLAMDQAHQNIYDELISVIDQSCNQSNDQGPALFMEYNRALLEVLQSIRDAAAPSLQWARNHIAVIQIDLEKAEV